MGKPAQSPRNAPSQFFGITPNDSVKFEGMQWIRVGGAGNLVIKGVQDGATARTYAVTAGEYVPFGAGYVMAATTATTLEGLA
jgi:hypothetical protein